MPAKTLIQLDTDSRCSTFDAITAIDAGAEHLLAHASVDSRNVEPIIHGAMFTRGGDDLASTAVFVGGSDVANGEKVFERVQKTFFGPCRVSVMLDSNGSNTTAAAAVLSASKHLELSSARATVLAGTGPVGIRTAELLHRAGADVRLTSRSMDKAKSACEVIAAKDVSDSKLEPVVLGSEDAINHAIADSRLVISCGGAGISLWPLQDWQKKQSGVQVAIDLNAVPPAGIEAIGVTDKAKEIDGTLCYGAIGVGGLKMKIHRKCIQRLFESNDLVLDAPEIYSIGLELLNG